MGEVLGATQILKKIKINSKEKRSRLMLEPPCNAYLTETWGANVPGGAPLQRQVQMLFSQLANKLGDKRSLNEFVDSEVMSAYFIPFRSPSIAALPRRKESLAFAIRLWSAILELWMPRCILTIDTVTFGALKTPWLKATLVTAAWAAVRAKNNYL
jgi:hypothetical protein